MVDRINPDDRHLYGAAGHQHCQRLAPTHCRGARNQPRLSDLGADQLPGGERGGSPPQRMAKSGVRPQELLYRLRGPVLAQLLLILTL